MTWPGYDAQTLLGANRWWGTDEPRRLTWDDDRPFVHPEAVAPSARCFAGLDLLGDAPRTSPLLSLDHDDTRVFYAAGATLSDLVLDGDLTADVLADLSGAHQADVRPFEKRAVVHSGAVQRYWPPTRRREYYPGTDRETQPALVFFVPETTAGDDGLVFTHHWSVTWELPTAVVLSVRMRTTVRVGSPCAPPAVGQPTPR